MLNQSFQVINTVSYSICITGGDLGFFLHMPSQVCYSSPFDPCSKKGGRYIEGVAGEPTLPPVFVPMAAKRRILGTTI